MVLAAFFFSLMTLLVKVAGQRIPGYQIVLARSIISVSITWYLLQRRQIYPWGHKRGLLVFRGAIGFAALLCLFYSLPRLTLAEATVIHYMNPVFVILFAPILLHERLRRIEVVGVAISMGGVILMARPGFLFGGVEGGLDPIVVGVALTGAMMSGIAYLTVRKLKTEHALVTVFYFPLVATICAIPLMIAFGAVMPTPFEWFVLLGVGLTTQAAQVYLTKGLQLEPAGRASAISYVQILFAAFWGLTIFGEIPGPISIGGGMLVIGGSLLVARRRTVRGGR
jgi:drug/metabolite transporter (DMT)-like permease